jgi:hypothetical protein
LHPTVCLFVHICVVLCSIVLILLFALCFECVTLYFARLCPCLHSSVTSHAEVPKLNNRFKVFFHRSQFSISCILTASFLHLLGGMKTTISARSSRMLCNMNCWGSCLGVQGGPPNTTDKTTDKTENVLHRWLTCFSSNRKPTCEWCHVRCLKYSLLILAKRGDLRC